MASRAPIRIREFSLGTRGHGENAFHHQKEAADPGGVLRLHSCFALQSSYSAQDDNSFQISQLSMARGTTRNIRYRS